MVFYGSQIGTAEEFVGRLVLTLFVLIIGEECCGVLWFPDWYS